LNSIANAIGIEIELSHTELIANVFTMKAVAVEYLFANINI
jgi:hypothetical protein